MTEALSFTLEFARFAEQPRTYVFPPGLHIIYGESGVGKSNLVRRLLGLPGLGVSNYRVIRKSLPGPCQVVFQNPDCQIVGRTVAKELAFHGECTAASPGEIVRMLEEARRQLPLEVDPERHPVSLSGGEKELLNLVTSLQTNPRVLFIDDGMSFLGQEHKQLALDLLRRQIASGRVIILWFTSDIKDTEWSDSVWDLTLSSLSEFTPSPRSKYPQVKLPRGNLELILKDIRFGYRKDREVFSGLTAVLPQVRCLGITGPNGCGKTSLANILLGTLPLQAGIAYLRCPGSRTPAVGYLDQFPEKVLAGRTLESFADELINWGYLEKSRLPRFQRRLARFGITWEHVRSQPADTLSWSLLRMVMVFLLTHTRYPVLLLDEPTFGLGWEQKYRLMLYLQEVVLERHLILISHDREFIRAVCDRILDLETREILVGQEVFAG